MGSAIASPSTTPVAFVGRPHGPPRCKSAPLYHRAQVARPISQGLQGGETPLLCPVAPGCAPCARLRPLRPVAPGCARLRPVAPPAPGCARLRPVAPACTRLRPVAPGCAVPHHPAPSRTVAPGPFRGAAPSHPSPFALQRHRTPAPSHPSAIAPRPLHTPVPSRSSAIAPRPLRTPVPSHPGPSRHFFNRCHCFSRRHLPRKPTLIQPYSLRGNRWKSTTGQSLLTRCFFFSSC